MKIWENRNAFDQASLGHYGRDPQHGPRADVLGLAIIILSSLPGTLSPPPALCA